MSIVAGRQKLPRASSGSVCGDVSFASCGREWSRRLCAPCRSFDLTMSVLRLHPRRRMEATRAFLETCQRATFCIVRLRPRDRIPNVLLKKTDPLPVSRSIFGCMNIQYLTLSLSKGTQNSKKRAALLPFDKFRVRYLVEDSETKARSQIA